MNNYFDKLTERFAGALFFAVFAILLVLIAMLIGCETTNPLCTDNYCVEGEIYPRSDLYADEDVSDLAIESPLIMAVLNNSIPDPPQIGTPTTAADIVSYVEVGGRDCIGNTYTLEGTVDFELNTAVTLVTENDSISFFVSAHENPEVLEGYNSGETYTFELYIRDIKRSTSFGNQTNIWSDLVEE